MPRVLKVQLYRSTIGRPRAHRRIVAALGLRRVGQTRELPDNPGVRGMVRKIPHLVRILDQAAGERVSIG